MKLAALALLALLAMLAWWTAPAAAQTTRGDGWEVRLPDQLQLTAGTPTTLAVAIAVDRGQTVSKDASVYVDLAPPPGVTIKRRRWQRPDAVDPEADEPRFTIPVRPDPAAPLAADASIAIHLRFWLCGQQVCRPIDVRRQVPVRSS